MKQRRLDLGLTQQEVADKLGHNTHHTVQRWEAGTRPVEVEDVPLWADALGIPRPVALQEWVLVQTGELTSIPDLSMLNEVEGYNDLDGGYRQAAEQEFEERKIDVAEMAVAKWLRRQRKRDSIGGIGEN